MALNKKIIGYCMVAFTIMTGFPGVASAVNWTDSHTYSDLDRIEVYGLWKTLHKFKVNGGYENEIKNGAGRVLTKFIVPSCGNVTDPYNESWACDSTVKGVFMLTNKFSQGVSSGGSEATITYSATGDTFKDYVHYYYQWNAATKQLTVLSSSVDSIGSYNVKAKSVNSVTTQSSNYSVGVDFSSGIFGVGFGMSKETTNLTSKLIINIEGSGYKQIQDVFSVARYGSLTQFTTGMHWISQALLNYSENATLNHYQCSGNNKFDFSASYLQATSSGTANAASASGSQCRVTSEQLTAKIQWQVSPLTQYVSGYESGVVGQKFNNYIRVAKNYSGAMARSEYYAVMSSASNWSLDVDTVDGSNTGGGFEIASGGPLMNVKKNSRYITDYY